METKKCIKCEKELPIESFSFRKKNKGLKRSDCKDCFNQLTKKHYNENKKSYRTNWKNRQKELKEYVKNHLSKKSCVDCGNSDIRVLDFDHVRGIKFANISSMVHSAYSLDKIIHEISKCEIRCANCHRIVTYTRNQTGLVQQ